MKKLITIAAVLLTGCANGDYKLYVDLQKGIIDSNNKSIEEQAKARSLADVARYNAFSAIAVSGDTTAKIATVMAMQNFGQNNQPQQQQTVQIAAPISTDERLLRWASVIIPGATQMYGIKKSSDVAINSSNNAAAVAQSTNNTFASMGQSITTTAQSGFTGMTSVSNSSNNALATVAGSGLTALQNVSTSSNAALTDVAIAGTVALTEVSKSNNLATTEIVKSGNSALTTVAVAGTTALTSVANTAPKVCSTDAITNIITCN